MAYSETINLVQGDTLPQLKVTIRDQNTAAAGKTLDPADPTTWKIIDLTGATVRMKVRAIGETTLKDTIVGTVTNGPAGEAVFIFNTNTLSDSGDFEAEIEMTTSTGSIQTVYELIKLRVREQF